MEMVEAVVGKLRQLSTEGIWGDIGVLSEVDNLDLVLKEMQSLLKIDKKQQQQLLFLLRDRDYDHEEDDDLVEELVYQADNLVDKIIYHGLPHAVDVGDGGVFGCFMGSLLNLFPRFCPAPTEWEEAADLTRRIRLVNAKLLTKTAKAIHPPHHHHPSQGGQGQRGAGDVDDVCKSVLFDDEGDIWNPGDSAVDYDFLVGGGEGAIEELLCGWLVGDGKNKDDLKIITICGMGGIGKTTLARKLAYEDYSVRHHFDFIAWATVGKSFRTRHVLEDLLLQNLFQNREDMAPFSDLDLIQKLYEFLQPKRYLIVLDDVWSSDACTCLSIAFPCHQTTGSRVLLTTRDTLVPENIGSSCHNMRALYRDEDWDLLRRTAFRGDKSFTFYSVVHY